MSVKPGYDVAVVGAGPAGMAAATVAARAGLDTVLFDEQRSAGGQVYRAIAETTMRDKAVLGRDYWRGAGLVREFQASGAAHVAGATVWSLSPGREIGVSVDGASHLTTARRVILATGAMERPFPIPGWTLPGVMGAGAAQVLLKSSGLVPSGRTVLAGCGPLIWLVAWQYLNAGARIEAILDTTPRANWRPVLGLASAFIASPYFAKGLKLLWEVRRRVRVLTGVTALSAQGKDRVEAVAYRRGEGAEERLPADLLLLHQGVVPNVNLAMAAGVAHRWDDVQLCWSPVLDSDGATSVEGIAVAGDGAGIGGAEMAEARGRLAGIAAAKALKPGAAGLPDAAEVRAELADAARGRAFLDRLYRPAPQFRRPAGDTIVCRCEEVTARQVGETVGLGGFGPNQMKAFLRCGMGPCQGRFCGLTVAELIAEKRGVSPAEVGYYRLRPPVKPITLAELAALPKDEASIKAVLRD